MASLAPKCNMLCLLFLCLSALTLVFTQAAGSNNLKTTKMTMYLSDIMVGPEATYLPIAGPSNQEWSLTEFGTLYSFGDFLTLSPERNAPRIGRGEGFVLVSKRGGNSWYSTMSIAFSNKDYNLSSIELQGVYNQFAEVNELSVVGGTRKFRLARGYAQFKSYSMVNNYWTVAVNLTLFHHDSTNLAFPSDSSNDI